MPSDNESRATTPSEACGDLEVIDTAVPKVFFRLAKYYHQSPEVLAALLVIDFCQHPPRNLIIIETAS
jgi:hypothetical protein